MKLTITIFLAIFISSGNAIDQNLLDVVVEAVNMAEELPAHIVYTLFHQQTNIQIEELIQMFDTNNDNLISKEDLNATFAALGKLNDPHYQELYDILATTGPLSLGKILVVMAKLQEVTDVYTGELLTAEELKANADFKAGALASVQEELEGEV